MTNEYINFGGHRYRGNLKEGAPHGFGQMLWADGCVYEGDWNMGKMHGNGTMTWPDHRKYTGAWTDNRISGQGIMHYSDGTSFEGFFEDGRRHGRGIRRDAFGQRTECEYCNDVEVQGAVQQQTTVQQVSQQSASAYTPHAGTASVAQQTVRVATSGSSSGRSWLSVLWLKSWRLLASLACFACAGGTIWLIMSFFRNGGGHAKVGLFLAPLLFGYYGVRNLFSFFMNLFRPLSRI